MTIPLVDLKLQNENINDEINTAIKEVIGETNFILGSQVKILEEEIIKYCGTKFAVGVASGTDALVLALVSLGVGKDDEVITTPFTFIATAEAISRTGARPVFCDIDERTYNIDVNKIEARITKHTKAILPVHLYGLPCDMDRIMAIAKEHKLNVIEDCAQSFGSEYEDKKVGTFGDCGCFSFFPAKILGCYGDGGMIITDSEEIAHRLKSLRNHGSTKKYYYGMHGFNSRLDTLQAAVLMVKMRHIDNWINKRIENAKYYNKLLTGLSNIVTPQISNGGSKHSFNYYTVRIKEKRSLLQETLKKDNITSAIYYPLCLHLQEVYKDLGYRLGNFPIAEQSQGEVLSLPMYPELTKEQILEITNAIKKGI